MSTIELLTMILCNLHYAFQMNFSKGQLSVYLCTLNDV